MVRTSEELSLGAKSCEFCKFSYNPLPGSLVCPESIGHELKTNFVQIEGFAPSVKFRIQPSLTLDTILQAQCYQGLDVGITKGYNVNKKVGPRRPCELRAGGLCSLAPSLFDVGINTAYNAHQRRRTGSMDSL